jgi:hypothetical protein
MNDQNPTPSEFQTMREFLARVITIPLLSIKITGDPATDENTDLLQFYQKEADGMTIEKLCAIEAIEIDNILAGECDLLPGGKPNTARAAALFREFVAHPVNLYP